MRSIRNNLTACALVAVLLLVSGIAYADQGEISAALRSYFRGLGGTAGQTLVFQADGSVAAGTPSAVEGETASVPVGTIIDTAGGTIPDGYLACNGAAVSRTTYALLFTAIGTTWGGGDGSTTFNVPDLRGRTTVGSGTGSGLTARTLGQNLGKETADLPAHTHNLNLTVVNDAATTGAGARVTGTQGGGFGESASNGGADDNLQPSAVVTKAIYTGLGASAGDSSDANWSEDHNANGFALGNLSGLDVAGIMTSTNLRRGAGSPEGAVVGSPGDIYQNTTGGASTTLYVKESGSATNTGWVAAGAGGASGWSKGLHAADSIAPVGSAIPDSADGYTVQGRTYVGFDPTTKQARDWETSIPESYSSSSAITVEIDWISRASTGVDRSAGATSGAVVWSGAFERLHEASADLDSTGFDSFQTASAATTSATSGVITTTTITFTQTQADEITAGDLVIFRLVRDTGDATDTMTGDAAVLAVRWKQ
jgi:microcystin-dependent protein